jgi:hypothetical protein
MFFCNLFDPVTYDLFVSFNSDYKIPDKADYEACNAKKFPDKKPFPAGFQKSDSVVSLYQV